MENKRNMIWNKGHRHCSTDSVLAMGRGDWVFIKRLSMSAFRATKKEIYLKIGKINFSAMS